MGPPGAPCRGLPGGASARSRDDRSRAAPCGGWGVALAPPASRRRSRRGSRVRPGGPPPAPRRQRIPRDSLVEDLDAVQLEDVQRRPGRDQLRRGPESRAVVRDSRRRLPAMPRMRASWLMWRSPRPRVKDTKQRRAHIVEATLGITPPGRRHHSCRSSTSAGMPRTARVGHLIDGVRGRAENQTASQERATRDRRSTSRSAMVAGAVRAGRAPRTRTCCGSARPVSPPG